MTNGLSDNDKTHDVQHNISNLATYQSHIFVSINRKVFHN